MKSLLVRVIFVNLGAAVIVFVLSLLTGFFKTTSPIDFLFFMALVMWTVAILGSMGRAQGKTAHYDDPVSGRVYKMVKDHDFDQDSHEQRHQSKSFFFVLLVASLPSSLVCFITAFL